MREKTLYKRVEDSEVFGLLYGINHQLLMLPPNGARNHQLNSLRSRIVLRIDMIKEGHYLPLAATISDYKKQEPMEYSRMIQLIEEAEKIFAINPEMTMYPARVKEEALVFA